MGNYLYNGIELPGLPDWDKTAYPYAFIYIVTLDGTTGVYTLVVGNSSTMSYDDNGIICPAANVGQRYTVSGESWAEAADSDDFYIKRDDLIYTVWANFDVLNSDGTVYVAASEPVAVVGKFPLREWLSWLIAGLCSRPLPLSKREPVAYLYNGVRLPALPEWDREMYPYAWIAGFVGSDGSISYVLRTSSEPVTYKLYWLPEPDYYVYSVNGNGHIMPLKNEEWQPFNMDTQHSNYFNVDRIASSWANHDIINTDDGTLYLAASDPIPVYE